MIATLFAAAAATTPFGAPPIAPVVVRSYRLDVASNVIDQERLFTSGGDRVRARTFGPFGGIQVSVPGATYTRFGTSPAALDRRRFIAPPDGFPDVTAPGQQYADYAVTEARAGRLALTPVTLGGRAALRAEFALTANDCAGLRAGRARLWLSARTLLPLRVEERRAGRRVDVTVNTYRSLNHTLPSALFTIPRAPRPGDVIDYGFRRTSPALASGPLPYIPRLPTLLPAGFTRSASGWAPRTATTGPEGSNPRDRWLFAAVFTRGPERIGVTQRVGSARSWPTTPFGFECAQIRTEPASVNGVRAEYAIGPMIPSSLTWRDGPILSTVSGPFPKADLVAIAASIRKIGGG